MDDAFARTRRLLGGAAMERLAAARVAVFGLGGVGGHAAEALARSGVGALDVFDGDRISVTNLNRQIIATRESVGRLKAEVMVERMLAVNPALRATGRALFYLPENADEVDLSRYDYVIDAVDTVAAKLELAVRCARLHVPEVCALGAGNKLDPTRFRVCDLSETRVDPLARVMRRELRKRGVTHLKVVYSEEEPIRPQEDDGEPVEVAKPRRIAPGSVAFVPAVMGLILAREVVCDLTGAGKQTACTRSDPDPDKGGNPS